MTNKEAVEFAEKLKEYCEKRHCTRCPFKIKVDKYNYTCLLNYPISWEKERAIKELTEGLFFCKECENKAESEE